MVWLKKILFNKKLELKIYEEEHLVNDIEVEFNLVSGKTITGIVSHIVTNDIKLNYIKDTICSGSILEGKDLFKSLYMYNRTITLKNDNIEIKLDKTTDIKLKELIPIKTKITRMKFE